MHKKLHFSPNLVPFVLSGQKVSTWRLWDDKELKVGDVLDFLESGTEKHFATAKLIKVIEKKMGDLTKEDKTGHEKFSNDNKMYKTYSGYYNKPVNSNTIVKVIRFKLLK